MTDANKITKGVVSRNTGVPVFQHGFWRHRDEDYCPQTGEILGTTKKSKLTIAQLQARLANKSNRYWEEMRTNLNLITRAEQVTRDEIENVKAELRHILEYGILNYPQTLSDIGFKAKMSLKEKKDVLGLQSIEFFRSKEEEAFVKRCAYSALQVRKQNWAWRIAQEAEEKQAEGWYPFFVTLTVDPKKTDSEVLWREGREFRKYIRLLADVVCSELGDPPCNKPPYNPESNYVTYAGVIEHGKSRKHHHGHFVIWLRAIPANWRADPNSRIRNPAARTRNKCLPMQRLWKWSGYDPETGECLSPCQFFRSVGDVWSTKHRFITPMKDGKELELKPARAAGYYVTKYMQKDFKQWNHRVKATRNLGMNRLKNLLAKAPEQVVEALAWRPKTSHMNTSVMMIHSVPLGLIRLEAKRQDFLNKFKCRLLDFETLTKDNSGIFSEMLRSVRGGARPDKMDSPRFYDWVGEHLPDLRGYSNSRLLAAHALVGTIYPREKRVRKHVKIGGNDIGYP